MTVPTIVVWVLIVTQFGSGSSISVSTTVIDNIATADDCKRVAAAFEPINYMSRSQCIQVRKTAR